MALVTQEDFDICEKYTQHDKDGRIRCYECPLTRRDPDEPSMILCKAIAHYDRHKKRWVYDD